MRGAHLFELRLKVGEPKKISWVSRCICSIGLTVSAPRRVRTVLSRLNPMKKGLRHATI
jgi:hypothetical protein